MLLQRELNSNYRLNRVSSTMTTYELNPCACRCCCLVSQWCSLRRHSPSKPPQLPTPPCPSDRRLEGRACCQPPFHVLQLLGCSSSTAPERPRLRSKRTSYKAIQDKFVIHL